jgi:multiple sugar transport system substrate-binding protein
MKHVFLVALLLLVTASFATYWSYPDRRSDLPVIYWGTDPNPARQEQVRLFNDWLQKNGHPTVDLRLDMANADRTKKIIQGVSGAAGDVVDLIGGGGDMRYFRALAINTDVTEAAKAMGFEPSKTYPAVAGEITLKDETGATRQYQFPCNVVAPMFFMNRETFRRHGQPPPPRRWTIEEFERRGVAFVHAANASLPRQRVFFADQVAPDVLRASFGGSRFNETGTRCTLDEPPNLAALRTLHDWTYDKRILPSAADRAAFTAESRFGVQAAQLFASDDPAQGQLGLLWTGRYMLIELRKYDAARKRQGRPLMDLAVTEPPHGGFPNTSIMTRAAMVYAGSEHRESATLFLAFLASEEYNTQIVNDGDSLPPNPAYTKTEAYLRPAAYPNEWDVHGPFADAATTLAVGTSYSPFVLHLVADRIETAERERYMSGLSTLEQAAAAMTAQVNAEIDRTLRESPGLRPLYERLTERQREIDQRAARLRELSAAGRPIPDEAKIPLEWIDNAFHRAYYPSIGWTK